MNNDQPTRTSKLGERVFLGFDFGLKRTGIAIGQELTGTASGLANLDMASNDSMWATLDQIVQEWRPDALILGIPYHLDGTPQDMTANAKKFGVQLQARYNLPVIEVDERLSSYESENTLAGKLKNHSRTEKRQAIDREAAKIILQSWLNSRTNSH